MEIVDNKALILRTRNPNKYSIIPKHKVLGHEDGIYQVAVYWGLDETRVLKILVSKMCHRPSLSATTGRESLYQWLTK
jgi:hypothetical protein